MRHYWPRQHMQDLYLEAIEKTEVTIELPSPREAYLFRFALYKYRTSRNLKEFQHLSIEIDGNKLTIFTPKEFQLKKVS